MSLRTRPLRLPEDLDVLHAWVTAPRAVFWQMQGASRDDVAAEYARIDADPHHHAWLGLDGERPAFLTELYDPRHDPVGSAYDVRPGDRGMHVLVAPPDGAAVHGHTRRVMTAVLDLAFADPAVERVVVEPDVRNDAVRRLNRAAGFTEQQRVHLPDKTALLSFCTRAAHRRARAEVPADPRPERSPA